MAYFANGCEGMIFDEECVDCIYGKEPCPIAWVQSRYNYEACNNKVASAILNDLVRQGDNFEYIGCTMKKIIDKQALKGGAE